MTNKDFKTIVDFEKELDLIITRQDDYEIKVLLKKVSSKLSNTLSILEYLPED